MSETNAVLNYLENLPTHERNTLGILRNQIIQLVPQMEERLSRGVPFFYYKGKRAVGFRSSKNHLSFFIMEGNVFSDLKKEIAHLDYSSTVIRFNAKNPIPENIIKILVRARIEEIEKSFAK